MDLVQDRTTAARPVRVRIIDMQYTNLKYLTGFLHYLNKHHIYLRSRRNGIVMHFLKLCHCQTEGLKWTFSEGHFPFDPKTVPKIKSRKARKNCYRCFSKYKRPLGAEKSNNVWGEVNDFFRQNKNEIIASQH